MTRATLESVLKQLQLFEAPRVPKKRKWTRKRIEREAAKPSPFASSGDPNNVEPFKCALRQALKELGP